MSKMEISASINCPVAEVFAMLSNIEKEVLWESSVIASQQTSPGPLGVGATLQQTVHFLGRQFVIESEVTEYEPDRRLAVKTISGPFSYSATYTLEASEGGTLLQFSSETELGGFFKLADPLVMSMGKRQIETDLANLKTLLEAQVMEKAS